MSSCPRSEPPCRDEDAAKEDQPDQPGFEQDVRQTGMNEAEIALVPLETGSFALTSNSPQAPTPTNGCCCTVSKARYSS